MTCACEESGGRVREMVATRLLVGIGTLNPREREREIERDKRRERDRERENPLLYLCPHEPKEKENN